MKKHLLMLSAASAALMAGPAFAANSPDYTNIVTNVTVPIKTSTATPGDPTGTPGNIAINALGSMAVTTSANSTSVTNPAITIDSDNTVTILTTQIVTNDGANDTQGILVDLTNATMFTRTSGITDAGILDLTGAGATKYGIWLQGSATTTTINTFAGDIDLTGSTMSIQGDSSVGFLQDADTILNGNLTLGSISVTPSTATSTLKVIGVELLGNIDGNVVVAPASSIGVSDSGGQAFLVAGNLTGALENFGTISAASSSVLTINQTGNPEAGNALVIGGSIAGGIYNGGKVGSTADTTTSAAIVGQSNNPVFIITPGAGLVVPTASITIGVNTTDTTNSDPGFSFYNRGTISATPSNLNDSSNAVDVSGFSSSITTTLTGGIFNSGSISATSSSAANGTVGAAPTTTSAVIIGDYAIVGPSDTYTGIGGTNTQGTYQGSKPSTNNERYAFVNSNSTGSGSIAANVSGALGGQAVALRISQFAVMPSLLNLGTISAVATTTDLTIVPATSTSPPPLSAFAIIDQSGTLTNITNSGTIAATGSILDDNSQVVDAIDLSTGSLSTPSGNGVAINNIATSASSASILGNILLGTGDNQIINVIGNSPASSGGHPAAIVGNILYGSGSGLPSGIGSDQLNIGAFGTVTGIIVAPNQVAVDITNNGSLVLQNVTVPLTTSTFHVASGGAVTLNVAQELTSSGVIASAGPVNIDSGATLGIAYGSYVPSSKQFVLIGAPAGELTIPDLPIYQALLDTKRPFLFASEELTTQTSGGTSELVLNVVPKTAAELGLAPNSYGNQLFPFANAALVNDDVLGAAMINGVAGSGTVGSAAYIASGNASAQQAYDQFAPDVTDGARAIAISLTDQATGPVAARQRMLRLYGKTPGEVTLWGQEFASTINDPGQPAAGKTGFKDRGFGFVLGMDGGDPKMGWYGGAFTFYSGDVTEALPRDSHTDSLWYMLTGYTDWRGRGLFLDTKFDVGYAHFKERRFLALSSPSELFTEEADSKRGGLVGAAGFTTGVVLAYGATTLTPQLSVDAMSMRQEGFTESLPLNDTTHGNGMGFNLKVAPYYANSLRAFLGADVREDLDLGGFYLQPEARLGYRYDFLNDPVKLKTQFADIDPNTLGNQPGQLFTVVGPDPTAGNVVAGASLAATTDSWTMGLSFDYVRGSNGAVQQIGMINLLGRI